MVNIELYKFIKNLSKHRDKLTKQQLKTIRGQALAGDLTGARKGLNHLINRSENGR